MPSGSRLLAYLYVDVAGCLVTGRTGRTEVSRAEFLTQRHDGSQTGETALAEAEQAGEQRVVEADESSDGEDG